MHKSTGFFLGSRIAGIIAVCLSFNIFFARPAYANPFYVAPSGNDDTNNGESWNAPFATISKALEQDPVSLILVSNGVYNLSDAITIAKGVTVRSWNNGVTDRTNTVFASDGSTRCVLLSHADAVLDGFKITGGRVSGTEYGGGVRINSPGGIVTNCWITGNFLESESSARGGGGIYLSGGGSIWNSLITDNVVTSTSAQVLGGGILLDTGTLAANCHISGNSIYSPHTYSLGGGGVGLKNASKIQDSVISNNHAVIGYGGGILTIFTGPEILRCTVVNNNASSSGGGINTRAGSIVEDCFIAGNVTGGTGGGVYGTPDSTYGPVTITNSRVFNNQSDSNGGGIYLNSTTGYGYVYHCMVNSNTAAGQGGGVYLSGPDMLMYNSLITGNTAKNTLGGGVYANNNNSGMITACTVVGNKVEGAAGSQRGAGIYVLNSGANIYNCVIWSNRWSNITTHDQQRDLGFDLENATRSNAVHYICSPRDFSGARGNITNHPLFENFAEGNYRLAAKSPCVNAGTNQNWMTNAVDLDHYPRIDRLNRRVDMGCYERVTRGSVYSFW